MNSGKTKKGGRFAALVAAVEADGPFEAGVLASARNRAKASSRATRAAEQMVGAVALEKARVGRVAALLDELCSAEEAAKTVAPAKRRHASS